jgi:hypothetical protein
MAASQELLECLKALASSSEQKKTQRSEESEMREALNRMAEQQQQRQIQQMAEIAQAAASTTKSLVDSMATNRQKLLQSSLEKAEEREAATQARLARDRWRASDPEHNGTNAAIRYHNQNVYNQAWAANWGAGFKY